MFIVIEKNKKYNNNNKFDIIFFKINILTPAININNNNSYVNFNERRPMKTGNPLSVFM